MARSRSLKPRRSRAASRSRTTWLIGYGDSDSSSSSTASVAAHSASPSVTMRCASSVSSTRRARPSAGSATLSTRPARRISVTVWLIAEWVTSHSAASALMLIGPSRESRTSGMVNRDLKPGIPASTYTWVMSASSRRSSSQSGRQRFCSVGSVVGIQETITALI